MDAKELALAVAADHGGGVVSETEVALESRTIGLGEVMTAGSFLASCAHVAIEVWRVRQDRALLLQALAEKSDVNPAQALALSREKRLSLAGKIVDYLVPKTADASPSLGPHVVKSKKDWIKDWLGSRKLTATVLMPFADMDNFIVYEPISWSPDGAHAGLPAVTVSRGFVTDLATVPSYFWWAVPPTGKYGHAAILHDWLYWEQKTTREVADRVFDVAMQEMNVATPLRKTMWAAVRLYGGEYWQESMAERKRGGNRVLKRFPESASVTWEKWRLEPGVLA